VKAIWILLVSFTFSNFNKSTSVEHIGDFCNPNPVQNIHGVIRSDPNPVDVSKDSIQSGLYPKKLWLSILLQWSMQFGYPYLIRLSFFEIQSEPDPVLNRRIWLDRDPETGSCSTLKKSTPTLLLLRSKIPSGICAKLRTVAASNNRVHMPWSLYYWIWIEILRHSNILMELDVII